MSTRNFRVKNGIDIGSAVTIDGSTGIITASTFVGDGSGLTNVTSTGSGIEIKDAGATVGVAATIEFGANINVSPLSAGIVTVTAPDQGIAGIDTTTTSFFNDVQIGGAVTATTFVGDGSGLTGVVGSGSGVVVKDNGSVVGTAGTIDFVNFNISPISSGILTVTTESANEFTVNNINVTGVSTFAGESNFNNNINISSGSTAIFGSDLLIYREPTDTENVVIKYGGSNNLEIQSNSVKFRNADDTGTLGSISDQGIYFKSPNFDTKFEIDNNFVTAHDYFTVKGNLQVGPLNYPSGVDIRPAGGGNPDNSISAGGGQDLTISNGYANKKVKFYAPGGIEMLDYSYREPRFQFDGYSGDTYLYNGIGTTLFRTRTNGIDIPEQLTVTGLSTFSNVLYFIPSGSGYVNIGSEGRRFNEAWIGKLKLTGSRYGEISQWQESYTFSRQNFSGNYVSASLDLRTANDKSYYIIPPNNTSTALSLRLPSTSSSANKLLVAEDGFGTLNWKDSLTLSNLNVTGVSTFGSAYFGGGTGLGIGTNTTQSLIQSIGLNEFIIRSMNTGAVNGELKLWSDTITLFKDGGSETMLKATADGPVELYYDGSKIFETTGYGATMGGRLNVGTGVSLSSGQIYVPDKDSYNGLLGGKINVGDDLQIFSVGVVNKNYIETHEKVLSINAKTSTATIPVVEVVPDSDTSYIGNESYVRLGFGTDIEKLRTTSEGVSIGGTVSVDGAVKLAGINTTLVGTGGTTGDIKMILGAPFFHDGNTWREFYLKEGIPVTQSADTSWNSVIFRNTFDSSFTEVALNAIPGSEDDVDLVASPRKIGDKALRIRNSTLNYGNSSRYDFEGEWTIEGWFYFDTVPSGNGSNSSVLVSFSDSYFTDSNWEIGVLNNGNGTCDFYWRNKANTTHNGSNGTSIQQVTTSSIDQQWFHMAVVREQSDGSIHFYLNGTESSFTSANQVIDNDIINRSSSNLHIGGSEQPSDNRYPDVVIDDLRISTIARYTENFTAPTTALPVTGTLTGPFEPEYYKDISNLGDLYNVSSATPSTGQVLKWNGSEWAPASDLTSDGGSGITLTDLSVTTNSAGTNALSYNSSTGTFSFTPTSLSGYATESYVDNAVSGIATTGYVDSSIVGFITAGASAAGLISITGASAGTYGAFDKSAQITVDSTGRITNITEVGITTDGAGIDVSGISTFNDNVSFGSTILVDGAVNLAVNNATIAGTAGTTGDIKMIGGSPFFYDGGSWREFNLTSGTTVTVPEDTEWDNVIFRATFDEGSTDSKFDIIAYNSGGSPTYVSSPVKIGTKSLRLPGDSYLMYIHRSEYVFSGEWTIEGWFYFDTLPTGTGNSSSVLISKSDNYFNDTNWSIGVANQGNGTSTFYWKNNNSSDHNGTTGTNIHLINNTSLDQQWFHMAVVREPLDGSIHFYFNGTESSYTSSNQVIDNDIEDSSTSNLQLGRVHENTYVRYFDGNIDDLRISTVARYTSNFTPPTTALPVSGDLSLETFVPDDKYGEITLGAVPTWRGSSGVSVTNQGGNVYRLTYTTAYSNANDYMVFTQRMDSTSTVAVQVTRSTSYTDFTAEGDGSIAVEIKNHS